MLWCDKYRPHTLDKFLLHKQEADNLKKLATTGDCPHLLFYGQPGVGKKTFILAMLREMFGPGVEKLRVENRAWKIEVPGRETKVEVELTTVASNHHIELNPADAGFKDRYVISEVVKEMAKNRPLDVMGNKGFKVVVLNEVDRISKQAQHSLRRTMEKYSAGCRIILCCNNVSKVIEAIRSRCLCVRVAAPSNEEVIEILHTVSRRENLTLPQPLAERIAKYSDRNVRKALLCLETIKTHSYPFAENQVRNRPAAAPRGRSGPDGSDAWRVHRWYRQRTGKCLWVR